MTLRRPTTLVVLLLAFALALLGWSTAADAARVKPTTGVAINHSSVKVGSAAVIRGKVSPNQHGHRVSLQLRKGSSWKTVKRSTLNGSSRYKFTVRPTSTGTKRYRVKFGATKTARASVSRTVTLRVKARSGGSGGSGGSSGSQCTPGYSPCIPLVSDADCAGGSGDGPYYVDGPVSVTGSDPYDLDRDGDGVGCDS